MHFKLQRIIYVMLILIVVCILSAPARALTADEYYSRAAKKYVFGDLDGAAGDAKAALSLDPEHAKAEELLGVLGKEVKPAAPLRITSGPAERKGKVSDWSTGKLVEIKELEPENVSSRPKPRAELKIEAKKKVELPVSISRPETKAKKIKQLVVASKKGEQKEGVIYYQVAAGETLKEIASKFLGDERLFPEIVRINNIENPDSIFAGQYLAIDLSLKERMKTEGRIVYHQIAEGETMKQIAEKYLGDEGLFPEIVRINNIENPDIIFPGQQLKIDLGIKKK